MTTWRVRKLLAYVSYLAVVSFALCEVVVRISGYSARYISDPIYTSFPGSPDIGYVHKPNLKQALARGRSLIDTNEYGLRTSPTHIARRDTTTPPLRMAVFGASSTFGEGVRGSETFASRLEEMLNQAGSERPVEVINYGVSGYSVKTMEATLLHRYGEYRPSFCLIALSQNDFNVPGRSAKVDSSGYTYNSWRSGSLLSDFPTIPLLILRRIHLTYLIRDLMNWNRTLFSSRDVADGGAGRAHSELPSTYGHLLGFHQKATAFQCRSATVLLPGPTWDFSAIRRQHRLDEIPFIDLTDVGSSFTREQFRVSRWDHHPSPEVHRRLALRLKEELTQRWLGASPQDGLATISKRPRRTTPWRRPTCGEE